MLKNGFIQTLIAQVISKDESVISREIKRNSDSRSGEYCYDLAKENVQSDTKKKQKKFTLHLLLSQG